MHIKNKLYTFACIILKLFIMKLELKHLVAYLPYGLKCQFESEDFCHLIVGIENTTDGVSLISPFYDYGKTDISKVKPILRQLSDLDQDGEINTPEYLQGCCYSYVQNLISQHYDVFGLIENGLAIDINTL